MLEKALKGEFDREEALLRFGEMYATAIAGDGTVGPREVELAVGGELGGGAALLRLATLHLLNELLRNELKFGVYTYAMEGSYRIAAYGEDAAKFKRPLAVFAPSAGGEYLSDKFNEFVKKARVEVQLDKNSIRRTESGRVAADLIISEGGAAVKYNVYLREKAIELRFQSTHRSRAELAAILLRHAGVNAEVRKLKVGGRDDWYIEATTNRLAAGRKELRKALAEIVEAAVKDGCVDASKAEGWLKKLEKGLTLEEGWPMYSIQPTKGGLMVRFSSTNSGNIEREAQRLEKMGLKRGVHFTVKMPEDGREGYVSILRKGLEHAAWLSEHGEGEQRDLATAFVERILQRAEKAGVKVYKKVREIIEEGKAWSALKLERLEKKVEVNGREYTVKVVGWSTELKESQSGKLLLKIKIAAEIDGVKSEYTTTYGRYGEDNEVKGRAYGRRADAERYSALIKALTGKEPRIIERRDGTIEAVCGSAHLKGFMRYAELADAIKEWLEKTGRR